MNEQEQRSRTMAIIRASAERTIKRTADVKIERRDIPGEPDALQRWAAMRPEPEEPKRERRLDTMPPPPARADLVYKTRDDVYEVDQPDSGPGPELDSFLREVLAEAFAHERRSTIELSDQVHELRIEVARLTSELAVLRETRAAERAATLDLPPLPRRVN